MRKTKECHKYEMFLMFINQADIKWTTDTQVNMVRIAKWEKLFFQAYEDLESDVISIQKEPYMKCKRFIEYTSEHEDGVC